MEEELCENEQNVVNNKNEKNIDNGWKDKLSVIYISGVPWYKYGDNKDLLEDIKFPDKHEKKSSTCKIGRTCKTDKTNNLGSKNDKNNSTRTKYDRKNENSSLKTNKVVTEKNYWNVKKNKH